MLQLEITHEDNSIGFGVVGTFSEVLAKMVELGQNETWLKSVPRPIEWEIVEVIPEIVLSGSAEGLINKVNYHEDI